MNRKTPARQSFPVHFVAPPSLLAETAAPLFVPWDCNPHTLQEPLQCNRWPATRQGPTQQQPQGLTMMERRNSHSNSLLRLCRSASTKAAANYSNMTSNLGNQSVSCRLLSACDLSRPSTSLGHRMPGMMLSMKGMAPILDAVLQVYGKEYTRWRHLQFSYFL